MIEHVWLIPSFPLAAFLVNGLFGRRWLGPLTGLIGSAAIGASAIVAIGVFFEVLGGHGRTVVPLTIAGIRYHWIAVGDFSVDVSALVDPLSAVMLLVVTVVSFLIFVYSNGYMAHDHGFYRFFTWLSLFVFAMLILVMADNYLLLFVGWEGVGLCSYLLIGYWFERPEPYFAAKKAFVMNRIGDWGYTIGIIVIFLVFGSLNFGDVFRRLDESAPEQGVLTLICVALFFGATGKSAQLPLHSWLPDAMEGPTPVSALIHAATMVTAGVYLVARSTPLFTAAGSALTLVAVVGTLTAIFAATIALVQVDIKRVMAYSTVSQLGYMFLALGVGAPIAAIFHLATHAFFKALLFLGSGSVIHAMDNVQDMRRYGGLRRKLPWTYWTMLIAGGALSAIPPLAGFWSKDEIVGAGAGDRPRPAGLERRRRAHRHRDRTLDVRAAPAGSGRRRARRRRLLPHPREQVLRRRALRPSLRRYRPRVRGRRVGVRHPHHRRARQPSRLAPLAQRYRAAPPADGRRRQLRALDRRRSPPGPRRLWRVRGRGHQAMTHLLTLLIVIPLAGLVPLVIFRRDDRAVKQVAITTTAVELALSLWMLAQFHIGEADFQLVERIDWLPSLGIRYFVGVDGISVLLVPMSTLLTIISG